jgi:16S rRNA processing protein RimM
LKKLNRNQLLKLRQKKSLRSSCPGIRIIDPMAYSCKILLGHITKVNGYEGAVTVKLERSFIDNIPQMESVFLEIEGRPVPFFISESDYNGSDVLKLRFSYYDSADDVSEFKGCKVFLTSENEEIGKPEALSAITGYKVKTEENVFIGHINEVIQNPGQWLLSITSPQKREILIPLHEDLIVHLDDKNKVLVMKIPEGLTEIN